MSIHESDVRQRLERFLSRKQMPRRFEGKDSAAADEVRALCGVLLRYAPRADRLAEWWPAFEASLGEICGSMWPTEKELRDAAKGNHKALPAGGEVKLPTSAEIAATKMARGEAVGEGWLWGIGAVQLAAERLVDAETMQRYRSAAFFAHKDLYGEPAALRWEADRKDAHEAAKEVWRGKDGPRGRRGLVPNLRGNTGEAA